MRPRGATTTQRFSSAETTATITVLDNFKTELSAEWDGFIVVLDEYASDKLTGHRLNFKPRTPQCQRPLRVRATSVIPP